MINLHERMLPTLAGVEPATSWSPVRWRIQMGHQARPDQGLHCLQIVQSFFSLSKLHSLTYLKLKLESFNI